MSGVPGRPEARVAAGLERISVPAWYTSRSGTGDRERPGERAGWRAGARPGWRAESSRENSRRCAIIA